MIYLEMAGRIGNQLFRYAFAKRVQDITKEELIIDFKNVYKKGEEKYGWTNSLNLFKTKEYESVCEKKEIFYKNATNMQKIVYILYKTGNKIYKKNKKKLQKYQIKMQPFLNKYNLFFLELGYFNYDFNTLKNTKVKYICGCFESDKYFNDIKEKLIKEFEPLKEKEDKNKVLYKRIEESNSVCVTIRRGDFVNNEKNNKRYNICTIDYYKKAIQIIKHKIENPIFFMFSDDIKWVKENIKDKEVQFFYEDGMDSVDEKLRLMYSCKNFIISNSTFSWWAQYLSKNNEKIVISPSRWYKDGSTSELIDDKWIKLEV